MHPLLGTLAPLESVQGSRSPCSRASGGGAQAQTNGGETVFFLAKCMLGANTVLWSEERLVGVGEKWIADSSAFLHRIHSADLLSGVRLCDDKVRIGGNHLIDVAGYGTLTVLCSGDLTVKL